MSFWGGVCGCVGVWFSYVGRLEVVEGGISNLVAVCVRRPGRCVYQSACGNAVNSSPHAGI